LYFAGFINGGANILSAFTNRSLCTETLQNIVAKNNYFGTRNVKNCGNWLF